MCIVSVTSDANGKDTVDWSEKYPAGNGHDQLPRRKATVPTSTSACCRPARA
jgi:hypothetical protein